MKYIAVENGWSDEFLGIFDTEEKAYHACDEWHEKHGTRIFVREHVNYSVKPVEPVKVKVGDVVVLSNYKGMQATVTEIQELYFSAKTICDRPRTIKYLTQGDVQ